MSPPISSLPSWPPRSRARRSRERWRWNSRPPRSKQLVEGRCLSHDLGEDIVDHVPECLPAFIVYALLCEQWYLRCCFKVSLVRRQCQFYIFQSTNAVSTASRICCWACSRCHACVYEACSTTYRKRCNDHSACALFGSLSGQLQLQLVFNT